MGKRGRYLGRALTVTASVIALLVIGLMVVLNGRVLTGIVNRVAAGYVDGEVNFSRVEASVFRSFPYLNVRVEDADIVGGAELDDTLASVKLVELSLDYVAVLRGEYRVKLARMVRPRILAHYYDSTANWDIIRIPADGDTTVKEGGMKIPRVVIRRVSLEDSPYVLLTTPRDTLELTFDKCVAEGNTGALKVDVDAVAFVMTEDYGKMRIPVELEADLGLTHDDGATGVTLTGGRAKVAQLEMSALGEARIMDDSVYVKAEAVIDRCSVGDIVKEFGVNFPALNKLKTDAEVTLTALCDGWYVPARGELPQLVAEVLVPTASVDYEGVDRRSYVSLEASAETDAAGKLDVKLGELMVDMGGLEVMLGGTVTDAMGRDPLLKVEGFAEARIDTLTSLFTKELGIVGTGDINADLTARLRMSQLDLYKISMADIRGNVTVDGLIVNAWDTLSAYVDRAHLRIGSKKERIAASLTVDSLSLAYLDEMFVRGRKLELEAHASEYMKKRDTTGLFPFTGMLTVERLGVRDGGDLSLSVTGSEQRFSVLPSAVAGGSPELRFSGSNRMARMRKSVNRMGVRGLNYSAVARKRQAGIDTVRVRRPGRGRGELPSWMADPEFRKKDIDIRLDESIAKYFREWNVEGDLAFAGARLTTPYFPLHTEIRDVEGTFDGDELELKNMTLSSGESDISALASLKGIRRSLLGRGMLRLDAKVTSENINANEIMNAFAAGQHYVPDAAAVAENETVSDEAYEEAVAASVVAAADTAGALLILPGNFNANISFEAQNIRYNSLHITWMASDVAMKQRCLQITNTVATSNMGDIYFEGFYSTRSRDDLKVGFDLNMADITAEKVIQLFPAVDTIMPMLKTFKGNLDCEMAATSSMDAEMNLLLPSIDGVINIGGSNLWLDGSPELAKIAKTLRFRNRKEMFIDKMTVNGMIRDNVLEVFPFIISVDRYTLAASGIQHLDDAYKYHISVIKSPLPLKFGVNIWGQDFGNAKFGLGKAKYRNVNVPVFTMQLDTVKRNLVSSIHGIFDIGADRAVEANRRQSLVEEKKAAEHYNAALLTEELEGEEIRQLREAVEENVENKENDE